MVRAALLGVLGGCGASQAHSTGAAGGEGEAQPDARPARLTAPIHIRAVGFKAPESVLHDPEVDLYLVSNVEGSALDADDRAFISRITPEGSLDALKWIDSAQPDVTLNAPKGMAIARGILFVADIDHVRKFDHKTGKPLGAIAIAGATFLRDVAVSARGELYVSDSGLTEGFSDSGSDAIYRIDASEQVSVLAKGPELGHPSGLAATSEGLWVATFGSGELYRLGADGARADVQKLPQGSLDGLVAIPGGALVSSWAGSAVFRSDLHGNASAVVSELNAPADIGIDAKRERLLVPLFNEDAVAIHQL